MKIKPRELQYMIGGLVLGVLVGLLASSTGLFGTASDNDDDGGNAAVISNRFYLVEFEQAKAWLATIDPEIAAQIEKDFDELSSIGGGNIGTIFDISKYNPATADRVLQNLHNVLLKEEVLGDDADVNTCMGVEQDPYQGTGGVYLYLEVPENLANKVPADWQSTGDKQEDGILWSTQCYKDE